MTTNPTLTYDLGQTHWSGELDVYWRATAHKCKFSCLAEASWASTVQPDFDELGAIHWKLEFDGDQGAVLETETAVIYAMLSGDRLRVSVAAQTITEAKQVLHAWRTRYPNVEKREDTVSINFWFLTSNGPRINSRRVVVPEWREIAHNYTASIRPSLDHLMTRFRPSSTGQLILWNGPPGTGKTYALRALAREWKSWCDVEFIMDADNFFGPRADYLMGCLLGSGEGPTNDDDDVPKRWRLLVLEDAGELLVPDAREQVGQGLSRLLNLVDGLLGQGRRLLVLITTNEQVSKMHPAVVRDGRCAARIEFKPFSFAEAQQWLTTHGHGEDEKPPTLLSNLYARLNAPRPETEKDGVLIGFAGKP